MIYYNYDIYILLKKFNINKKNSSANYDACSLVNLSNISEIEVVGER